MSLPRMSLHIGDYKKDTGHLRAAGHGAYFLLIMHYWATGGLPDDDKQLAAIACMSDREWKQWKPILQAFFHDGWKHKRIETELANAHEKYERRASAGKRGGEAKAAAKQTASNASSNATAKPKQPITLTDNQERKKDAADAAPALDHDADLFRRGKEVLGQNAGGLIKQLKQAKGSIPLARAAIEQASTRENAREYIAGIIRKRDPAPGEIYVDPRL